MNKLRDELAEKYLDQLVETAYCRPKHTESFKAGWDACEKETREAVTLWVSGVCKERDEFQSRVQKLESAMKELSLACKLIQVGAEKALGPSDVE